MYGCISWRIWAMSWQLWLHDASLCRWRQRLMMPKISSRTSSVGWSRLQGWVDCWVGSAEFLYGPNRVDPSDWWLASWSQPGLANAIFIKLRGICTQAKSLEREELKYVEMETISVSFWQNYFRSRTSHIASLELYGTRQLGPDLTPELLFLGGRNLFTYSRVAVY